MAQIATKAKTWEKKEDDQLVKCKDTRLYLLLYIPSDYEEQVRHPWENNEERMRKTWGDLYCYMRH